MVNYNNGKIYALKSYQTEKIYIGSTVLKLYQRLAQHRYKYKKYLNGETHYITSYELIKYDDCYILLLDKYSCNDKTQLLEKEREYILKHKDICINKQIPLRTKKQYYIDNREKILKYVKENTDPEKQKERIKKWRDKNKNNEQIKIRKKEASKKWRDKNKDYGKKFYCANKDKILKRRSIWGKKNFNCICGSVINNFSKSRHNKTKKHLKYINNN